MSNNRDPAIKDWCVKIQWSQTDWSYVIVSATSLSEAENDVKGTCNARYVTGMFPVTIRK